MDGKPPGGTSKSLRPGGPPDTRLLSNPWMGGESRGRGTRARGGWLAGFERRGRGGSGGPAGVCPRLVSQTSSARIRGYTSSAESWTPSEAKWHSLFTGKNFSSEE